jgi:hypothetical protein
MKRTVFIFCLLVLTLGVWAGGAMAAYTYTDTTEVEWWRGHSPSGQGWSDVIGSTNVFDTFGADWSYGLLTIYTNWNPGKDGTASNLVKTADLFLYGTPVGNLAIRLDTTSGLGTVYFNPVAKTSEDIFADSGLYYGGRYDKTSAKPVPVWTTGSTSSTSTSVVWSSTNPSALNNNVVIDLAALGATGFSGFVWGTATCSNDGFAPIPGSLVLLGSGLLGLVGIGLRKKVN